MFLPCVTERHFYGFTILLGDHFRGLFGHHQKWFFHYTVGQIGANVILHQRGLKQTRFHG